MDRAERRRQRRLAGKQAEAGAPLESRAPRPIGPAGALRLAETIGSRPAGPMPMRSIGGSC